MLLVRLWLMNVRASIVSYWMIYAPKGFVRARIDGDLSMIWMKPLALDLKKKHTIEVVVDRFKIRDDIAIRLSESFETALVLADGIALPPVSMMRHELLFSFELMPALIVAIV